MLKKHFSILCRSSLAISCLALALLFVPRAHAASDELFGNSMLVQAPTTPAVSAAAPHPAASIPPAAVTVHPASSLEYRLGAGDVLKITVFNESDLSGEFKVDGTGMIALPLAGNIAVGGKTLREVETAIETFYADGYLVDPNVSAEVLNYRPFYILGEVTNPGSYPYVERMNAMNDVALAGGFTHRAKEDRFLITRAADPAAGKQPFGPGAGILPGDIIEVQERFF